jgi:hypothetical protein
VVGSVILAAIATVGACLGVGVIPRPSGAPPIFPILSFFPAVAIIGRWFGPKFAWPVTAAVLAVEAWCRSSSDSILIGTAFIPWFLEVSACLAVVAACASSGSRPTHHSSNKRFGQLRGLFLFERWLTAFFAVRQYVVEQRHAMGDNLTPLEDT